MLNERRTPVFVDYYETPIGLIKLLVLSDRQGGSKNAKEVVTLAHLIKFETIEIPNSLFPKGMCVESSKGWRFFISKKSNELENLQLTCQLVSEKNNLDWGSDSGQHLIAISIDGGAYQLHIGAEDEEVQISRTIIQDWLPKIFEQSLANEEIEFTEYIKCGLKSSVPQLKKGEKIYFHFLAAIAPIKKSKLYPDEYDVSAWYAVDQFKKDLDSLTI